MTIKYDIGKILPIRFEVKNINVSEYATTYKLVSKNPINGSHIVLNLVSEEEIDNEVNE